MVDIFSQIVHQSFCQLLFILINFYQKLISPILPARCRYYPTCSQYAKQALLLHGVWRGSGLLLYRIGRCHPFGDHGVDFVPLPLYQYMFVFMVDKRYLQGRFVYVDTTSYMYYLNHILLKIN